MIVNEKWILFLIGVIGGLLLALLLWIPFKKPNIVEIDLAKIIKAYAVAYAKSDNPTSFTNQEFKNKFQKAMHAITPNTIVVSQGQILSKHSIENCTQKILDHMGLNKVEKDAQTTKH